jgi:hypothetical protein
MAKTPRPRNTSVKRKPSRTTGRPKAKPRTRRAAPVIKDELHEVRGRTGGSLRTVYTESDRQLLNNIAALVGPQLDDDALELATVSGNGTAPVITPPVTGREFGVAGTEFKYGGLVGAIIGDDYNRDLSGREGLKKYDEMRRGDGGVRSILNIIKAPLIRAKPEIRLPKFKADALKEEHAAAEEMQEWLQWALLDDDAMQEDWDFYLRHQLLCVDFGFSVSEIVWQVDSDLKYRPERLAPRLPRTIYKWIVGRNGKLMGIVQQAHDPTDGKLKEFLIPGDNLMVTTFDREGDNFQGFGLLRSAYKHYYYKDQLYHIDMVRLDRFGVGIPMAELEEGFSSRVSELQKLEQILEGIRSSHKAYIISPPKAKISILTPSAGTGSGGAQGLMESIQHHDTMMARNALAHFMTMGQEKHGSWSLGVSFIDLFMAAEEALGYNLGSTMKRRVIRPMCDLNFPMTTSSRGIPVKYPTLAFTDIGRVDLVALADALSKLGAGGFITDDDGLEEFIRTKGNLPPLPADRNRAAREQAMKDAGLNPNIPPAFQMPQPEPGAPAPAPGGGGRLPVQASTFGMLGVRQPTPFERTVLSLHEIPSRLDYEEEQLARKIAQVRLAQLTYLANLVAKKDGRSSTAAHTDIRPDQIKLPARLASQIEALIRQSQDQMAQYGAQQVRLELVRQGAPIQLDGLDGYDVFDGDPMMLDDGGASRSRVTARSHLVSSAKAAAKRLNEGWVQKVLDQAIRLRKVGLTGNKLEREIVSALSPDAATNIIPTAQEEIRESFGIGRGTEASRHADVIEKVVQSAILDRGTCAACESVDGEEMQMGTSRQVQLNPPYVLCKGKEKCRCVQLYLYAGRRERSAIAASTNAPPPPQLDTSAIAAAIREVAGTFRAELESVIEPVRNELDNLRAQVESRPKPQQPIQVSVPVTLGDGRTVEFQRDGDGRLTGFVEYPASDASALGADGRELAYNPAEPRVPKGQHGGGKWTSGSRPGASRDAGADEVFYATPSDAILSLEAGRHVTIAREDLRAVLTRAKNSKVNDIDLTKLTIETTPLFAGGLNRPRITMPQIPKEHRESFIAEMRAQGVEVHKLTISPTSLLPVQNEINAGRVGAKLAEYDKGKKVLNAIFTSKDDYVLDGHHRWAVASAVQFESPNITIRQPIHRIMANHDQALALMEAYMTKHGIPHAALEFADTRAQGDDDMVFGLPLGEADLVTLGYNPSEPRVPKGSSGGGRWTSGGGGILPGMAREDQPAGTAGIGGLADAAPTEHLANGKVVNHEVIDSTGINELHRVKIEHNGHRVDALFKPEDGERWTDPGDGFYFTASRTARDSAGNTQVDSQGNPRRTYTHIRDEGGDDEGNPIRETIANRGMSLAQREVAAYEVSQILGLNNVPPTAMREVNGRTGMVQQFVPGATDFANHGGGTNVRDHFDMAVLDVVIGNTDRHQGNGIIDPQGKMWAIDHGYSFPNDNHEYRQMIVNTSYINGNLHQLADHSAAVNNKLSQTDWNAFGSKHGLDVEEMEALHVRVNHLMEAMDTNEAMGVSDITKALIAGRLDY